MSDTPLPPLDYEPPPAQRRRFALPPDWRRRLLVAALAAAVVFVITFEAARRAQSSAVAYMAGVGTVQFNVRRLQKSVDDYVVANGHVPAQLSDVPEIQKEFASYAGANVDSWGSPYQLVTRDGKSTVLSFGQDRAPGGEGVDADITATMTSRSRLTLRQFIQLAPMPIVLLICATAAGVTAVLTFQAPAKPSAPAKLYALLLTAAITGAAAVVVGFFIAAVHAPSGH
jgi:hypothetical protein